MFTPSELKRRALDFSRDHAGDSDEKSEAQNFWRDFFAIFGLTPRRIGTFEARATTLRGNVGFIDFFWTGTLLVEHKSRGKDLEVALKQALDYCTSGGLKENELPRFVVVCDFARFILVELLTGERGEFALEELHANLHRFNFILGYEQRKYKDEDPVNIKAAELMGTLHDELRRVGYAGHPLELFLVRLMFCFFADDTGIFVKDQFGSYIEERSREDGSDLGQCIAEVFRVLETDTDKRLKNLPEDLAAFPYVNGELFKETEDPPYFDKASRAILLHCAHFNWSSVSPAIFGSLFQSVMEADERRAIGAHYTSEKNILKTIHGLFLDELLAAFEAAKAKHNERALRSLLQKIAGIRLLDPACGCGNFLILAYRELRRLEIRILVEIRVLSGDRGLSLDVVLFDRGIGVDHLYGIEVSEFPAQIARVAIWIMDHLMNVELMAIGDYRASIPLKTSPKIVQANALRTHWQDIVNPEQLSYILGNPPFVGKHLMSEEQAEDMRIVCEGKIASYGTLDYVTAWYIKCAELILENGSIRSALVSTNSITQGEQPGILWSYLLSLGIKIHFAHRTFRWKNEARNNAAVFCVIIGFQRGDAEQKIISTYVDVNGEATPHVVSNISPYLLNQRDILIVSRSTPICAVPPIIYGSKPVDDGNLILQTDEDYREYLKVEPAGKKYIRPMVSAEEYLHGPMRHCFWLVDMEPQDLRALPLLRERIARVKAFRQASKKAPTREAASRPGLFAEIRQPSRGYVLIPMHTSESRDYVPLGFFKATTIVHNSCTAISDAELYHFGVISSAMHMAWMRQVCGRIKGDYRYSNNVVYNNFPWPESPGDGKKNVETAVQAVLDTRARHNEALLSDLYDPLSMPADLVRAHKALDSAVDKCYRAKAFKSELERVEYLFELYEHYCSGLTAEVSTAKRKGKKSKQ